MIRDSRRADLVAFLNICLWKLEDYDVNELAYKTGLSRATIYRWRAKKMTINMRVGTLQAISRVAGLQLIQHKNHASLRVVS